MPAIAASDIIRRLVRLVPHESLGELVLEMVEGALAAPPAAPPSAHVPNRVAANGNGSKRGKRSVPVPAPAARPVARGKGRSGKAPRQTGRHLSPQRQESTRRRTAGRRQRRPSGKRPRSSIRSHPGSPQPTGSASTEAFARMRTDCTHCRRCRPASHPSKPPPPSPKTTPCPPAPARSQAKTRSGP